MRRLLLVLLLTAPCAALAQAPAVEAFRDGVAAFERGAAEDAVRLLEVAWTADPRATGGEQGAPAYWLGRAYAAAGDSLAAAAAWRAGYDSLAAAGWLDVRLADAHVEALVATGADTSLARAGDVYLTLLEVAGPGWTGAAQAVLQRRVADAALVAPDSVVAVVVAGDPAAAPRSWTLRPDGGARLAAWWRTRDLVPLTPRNERVEEHLRRTHHAHRHFAVDRRPMGIDDRGELYIRLGPPERTASIRFDDPTFIREVFRFGVPVQPGDFPRNAFWSYGHLHDLGYFIFTEVGGAYQLGKATDLLPVTLRGLYGRTAHDENKALSALAALRYIYERLALEHIDFSGRYLELDNIATLELRDISEVESELRTRDLAEAIGEGVAGEQELGRISNEYREPAYQTARRVMRTSDATDTRAELQRRREMPHTYSGVWRNVPTLAVSFRTARFLDADGTTRTELYWSLLPDELGPSPEQAERLAELGYADLDRYLVRHTLVQRAGDGRPRRYDVGHVALGDGTDRGHTASWMVARGDTGRYFIAAQWDLLLTDRDAWEGNQRAVQLRAGIQPAAPLEALSADPARLVMSDLRPVVDDGDGEPVPYPYERLTPETPLGLYFEVYHLAYGDDDQARYTVEYEVRRGEESGGLRFLRGASASGTSARTTNTTTSTRADEYILLDLRDWKGRGTLDVVVRVTDEVTGQTTTRTLTFSLDA